MQIPPSQMPWRDFTHYRKQQVKPAHKRPVFVLALRAEPHVADPVRALRHALKRLLRDHGLRVVAIHERRGDMTTFLAVGPYAHRCANTATLAQGPLPARADRGFASVLFEAGEGRPVTHGHPLCVAGRLHAQNAISVQRCYGGGLGYIR